MLQLVVGQVDGDDLPRAGGLRADQRRQADAAEADHRDRRADAHLRGVDDRADAGEHRAAEQRGFVERHGRVDLHERVPRDGRVLGEHRAAEVMVQRAAAARAGAARRTAACRRRWPPRPARTAPAGLRRTVRSGRSSARRPPRRGRRRRRSVTPGAELLDDAGRLVAERHRHRPRPVAVDHRQVGVAQPGRGDLDQHLARTGRRRARPPRSPAGASRRRGAWRPWRAAQRL